MKHLRRAKSAIRSGFAFCLLCTLGAALTWDPPFMKKPKPLTPSALRERAVRFYDRYGGDLEQIRSLLHIGLNQLAQAYTLANKLPSEAIRVSSRTKSLASFLKKLDRKGWPQFYYPTDVAGDLIGARVVCWFLDDCHGFLDMLKISEHLKLSKDIEDYISNAKLSGYRSIHATANVTYETVQRDKAGRTVVKSEQMPCEIQIRTKLQDAWGDLTHEFHYKAKDLGVQDKRLEDLLSDVSHRLFSEDQTIIKFRKTYQDLADEKTKRGVRTGFRRK